MNQAWNRRRESALKYYTEDEEQILGWATTDLEFVLSDEYEQNSYKCVGADTEITVQGVAAWGKAEIINEMIEENQW